MSSAKKPVRNSQRWCSNHHLVLPSSLCLSPLLFKLISFSLTLHNSIISSLYISFVQVIIFFLLLSTELLSTAWKVSKCGVFPGPYFPVLGLNSWKYGPENTPYLGTFHAVVVQKCFWLLKLVSVFKYFSRCSNLIIQHWLFSLR